MAARRPSREPARLAGVCRPLGAIDAIRRNARFSALEELEAHGHEIAAEEHGSRDEDIEDDRLRLIFTCCHPALAADAQVALTLREVCGLSTEEIAQAFLTPVPTLAQRIVRARARSATVAFPTRCRPGGPARTAGQCAAGDLPGIQRRLFRLERRDAHPPRPVLEAIRLARLLGGLLPEAEVDGLLALMLLHEARRSTRSTADGELILLGDQDRSRWDRARIAEACSLVEQALASRRYGPYCLQAAIAAVTAEAPSFAETDWHEIIGLYDALLRLAPSPVVELNRAVAVAMRDGPADALALVDALLARGELRDYRFAHAARADLCRRLGRKAEAGDATVARWH